MVVCKKANGLHGVNSCLGLWADRVTTVWKRSLENARVNRRRSKWVLLICKRLLYTRILDIPASEWRGLITNTRTNFSYYLFGLEGPGYVFREKLMPGNFL